MVTSCKLLRSYGPTPASVCESQDVMGKPFELNLGVPQGVCFSPVAFTTTFEMVLQQVRPSFPSTPRTELGLPMEMQYADYTDFVSTSHDF